MWYAIGLIPLVLIAGVFWSFSKKQRQREADRARQFETLLGEARRGGISIAAEAPPTNAPAAATAVAAVQRADFTRKPRLLPQIDALLYMVFRAGLPDHEIFAGLTAADVVEFTPASTGLVHEQKLRRLGQQRVDLVVCTKQLEIVAVVICARKLAAAAADGARFAEECLQAAGIRLLRVDPAALPRHQQVRELIYGAGS